MGANSSKTGQSTLSLSSFLKRYQIICKNQEKNVTIVKSKQSSDTFIIKELGFVDKSFYERNLCRFNHFQERQQCENVLNLVKVWTQERTTLCSNTFKIFPMYEHSTVTLKDEMDARRAENKHFEQDELLGMVQSCVNAFNSQPPILVSPTQYFISQDGLLKINNHDLFDSEVLQNFNQGVYYSFEKMENFNQNNLFETDQSYLKQAIFSLGMTLISCVYLEDIGQKVYFPFHHNKRMRLNGDILESIIDGISSKNNKIKSEKFCSLIKKMIDRDPAQRILLDQIQQQLDQIVRLKQSRIQIYQDSETDDFDPEVKMAKIQIEARQKNKQNQNFVFYSQNLSTIQDNQKAFNTFKSKELSDASQLEILKEFNAASRFNTNQPHRQFQVPLVLSKNTYNQKIEPISVTYEEIPPAIEDNLPSPICRENPLFTNPQFLAKINEGIKQFSFKRKNSFASTEISRRNSNLVLVIQNHALSINRV